LNSHGQSRPRLIPLGRVAGVHGLKGGVRIAALPGGEPPQPETFRVLKEILVGEQRYQVLRAAQGRRHVLLHLAGVGDRTQAEALVGLEVAGEAHRFPPLPEGEYYCFQLLGLTVVDAEAGTVLGVLADILPTGAHDVYVVRRDRREVLLPAIPEVIRDIDLVAGHITVTPPPGLLALYAD
jgi:16S rRNA processing protein RimM